MRNNVMMQNYKINLKLIILEKIYWRRYIKYTLYKYPHLELHWKQRRMGLSEGGGQRGGRELWSRSSLTCGLEKTGLNEVCQTLSDWVLTRDFVWFCSLYADVFFCWKMLYYWPSPLSSLQINFHQETWNIRKHWTSWQNS